MTKTTPGRGTAAPVAPGLSAAASGSLLRWERRYAAPEGSGAGALAPSPVVAGELAGHNGAGRRALDLACGAGRHSVWLAERGWRVTGLDFSPAGLALAEAAAERLDPEDRPRFVLTDASQWEPRARWDLVLCAYFHAAEVLARVPAWLSDGGRLLVVTPAPDSPAGPGNPRFRPPLNELRAILDSANVSLHYERAETLRTPHGESVTVVHAVRRPMVSR
jgi:SAM-dependent methyltransferase